MDVYQYTPFMLAYIIYTSTMDPMGNQYISYIPSGKLT